MNCNELEIKICELHSVNGKLNIQNHIQKNTIIDLEAKLKDMEHRVVELEKEVNRLLRKYEPTEEQLIEILSDSEFPEIAITQDDFFQIVEDSILEDSELLEDITDKLGGKEDE